MTRTYCRSLVLLLVLALAGCGVLAGRPTPIPWAPTSTPNAPVDPQVAEATPAATPSATATPVQPTATEAPTATPTRAAPEQTITLEMPGEGQTVDNPVHLRGRTRLMPFEGTLVVRVYDARDRLVAQTPIIAAGELGGPATYTATVTYGGTPGPGRIEVLEFSPRDGSIVGETAVDVTLSGFPGGGYVERPAPLNEVTLPIKLLARVGHPNQEVDATLSWSDGTAFTRTLTTLEGLDGKGLLVVALDDVMPPAPHPPTQRGAITVHTRQGSPLAYQPVRILHPDDAGTMGTQVFWLTGEDEIVAQTLRIPQTPGIGRASLEALLWGPVPGNAAGYTTAIPAPDDVLNYPGRGPDWGERVRLNSLAITDGTAHADFSLELGAHAGGAVQVTLIREQIEAALLQFSTVDEVVITVNGVAGTLEP